MMAYPGSSGRVRGAAHHYGVVSRHRRLLAAVCIVLAAVIAACTAALFLIPSKTEDIGTAAQGCLVAAYYADSVINDAVSYSSYDDFKKDIDRAIAACSAVSGGGLDFLVRIDGPFGRVARAAQDFNDPETDADSGFTGGYTAGAKKRIDAYLGDIRRDAALALAALRKLDGAVGENTDREDFEAALEDAQSALYRADHAVIVVGNTEVSFAGIRALPGVNAAVIGADIVIAGDVLYMGADETVLISCDALDPGITLVRSADGDGVVMEAGDAADVLEAGGFVAFTLSRFGKAPEAAAFSADERAQFMEYIEEALD